MQVIVSYRALGAETGGLKLFVGLVGVQKVPVFYDPPAQTISSTGKRGEVEEEMVKINKEMIDVSKFASRSVLPRIGSGWVGFV